MQLLVSWRSAIFAVQPCTCSDLHSEKEFDSLLPPPLLLPLLLLLLLLQVQSVVPHCGP
jgi:hypothetical protein